MTEPLPLFDSGYSILDLALEEIVDTVGQFQAETGGALLGAYAQSLVTGFVFDPEATTTGASYVPSAGLTDAVQRRELADGLQFKGVVHSHPGAMANPSGPDLHSFGVGLAANRELGRYLAPIVTFVEPGPADNRISFDDVHVNFHVAVLTAAGEVVVRPCRPRVLWFARDCRRLAAQLGRREVRFSTEPLGDHYVASAEIRCSRHHTLTLAVPAAYPAVAPLALFHDARTDTTEQLDLRWPLTVDPDDRLFHALADRDLAPGTAPNALMFGRNGRPLTPRHELGTRLGLEPVLAGPDFFRRGAEVREGLLARSKGLLTDRLRRAHVLVAGCGSVGSYVAEQFVRAGVGHVTLLDPDDVSAANLSRANFTAADVGRLKVDALAERLLTINPTLDVTLEPSDLRALDADALRALFTDLDLVVSALDDRRAQLVINQWAYFHDVPAVYLGLFAGAKAGEACVVRPPHACFACATRFRTLLDRADQGTTDYGTGRLTAEIALAADIHSVSAVGVRLGLSCLMHDSGTPLAGYADTAAAEHSYALFAVSDDVPIVREVVGDAPAQYSHRSIWLTATPDDTCNVCGERRDEPGVVVTPTADDLRALLTLTADEPTPVASVEPVAWAADEPTADPATGASSDDVEPPVDEAGTGERAGAPEPVEAGIGGVDA